MGEELVDKILVEALCTTNDVSRPGDPARRIYADGRRLKRVMTSAASLSEIVLSVGFSDQAYLCRLFRQAFGQSPAGWRSERGILCVVASKIGMDENIP
jgi:AraC-like DNA-binding protein